MAAENISQTDLALKKVFFLPRILGAFPFNEKYEITKISFALSLSVLLLMNGLSTASHYYSGLFKLNIRRTLKVVVASSTNILSFLVLLKNRNAVLLLKDGLRNVEWELSLEGIKWNWDRKPMLIYRAHVTFCILLAVTIGLKLGVNSLLSHFLCLASYVGTLPILLTIIGQFISIQDILCSMFHALQRMEKVQGIVMSISYLHFAAGASQKIYGLQLLLYIACTSSFIICNLFLEISTAAFARSTYYDSFIHLLWFVAYILAILDVIMACNRTVLKAKKINDTLYQRMMDDESTFHINCELLEFHLTCCKELAFSAWGFFTLDNSFIYTMITCTTTYLVILLQYTQPAPAKYSCILDNQTTVNYRF